MVHNQIAKVVNSSFFLGGRKIRFIKKQKKGKIVPFVISFTFIGANVNVGPIQGQKWLNFPKALAKNG